MGAPITIEADYPEGTAAIREAADVDEAVVVAEELRDSYPGAGITATGDITDEEREIIEQAGSRRPRARKNNPTGTSDLVRKLKF